MAKETKFIKVEPDEVQETIDKWQSFGWELLGAPQEILNKTVRDGDSYTDSYGTTTTKIITEKTHYVKITFQRDKEMPNYQELVALETTYDDAYDYEPDVPVEPKYDNVLKEKFPVFFLILSILGFLLSVAAIFFVFVGIIFAILSIVKIVKWKKQRNEYQKEFDEDMERYRRDKDNYPREMEEYKEAIKIKKDTISRAKALVG
ncbi:MAG: tetraspanin family protein [Clostridiales bacterium]|jgi:hypothetical protein|nr:tetraspanin family protein [Clostridiales bacterium]